MGAEIFIVLIIFGTIFGIVYVAVASRTRVRLALVEKGADASIFNIKSEKKSNIFSIILINLSLLLISIGIGIFLAAILNRVFNMDEDIAYPGTLFTVAGIGLYIGYLSSSKIGKE